MKSHQKIHLMLCKVKKAFSLYGMAHKHHHLYSAALILLCLPLSAKNTVPSHSLSHRSSGQDLEESGDEHIVPDGALNYLVSRYIQNSKTFRMKLRHLFSKDQTATVDPYCLTYGNPKTARIVLMVWTSITCPHCSALYRGSILKLKKLAKEHSAFSLILRDYPTDPISLKGSAMVWSLKKNAIPSMLEEIHSNHDWMDPPERALEQLKALVWKKITGTIERHRVQSVEKNANKLKAAFNSRSADQKALNLTQVPCVMILERIRPQEPWSLKVLEGTEHNLYKIIQKKVNQYTNLHYIKEELEPIKTSNTLNS